MGKRHAASFADLMNSGAQIAGVYSRLMRTAAQQGDLGLVSARTIGYRTAMMAGALTDPVELTNPEFVRMGTEKVEAAAESAGAMAHGLADLQKAWMALFIAPAQAMTTALCGFGACRTPADLFTAQRRLVEGSIMAGVNAGLHFAESAAVLAGAGLHPIHRKASANARRLARVNGW